MARIRWREVGGRAAIKTPRLESSVRTPAGTRAMRLVVSVWRPVGCNRGHSVHLAVDEPFGRNDFADARRVAFGWIESSASPRHMGELLFQALELVDARSDLGPVPLDEIDDVTAWWTAAFANADHVADLRERQADCLRSTDERQSWQDTGVVRAVPRGGSSRGWDQARLS